MQGSRRPREQRPSRFRVLVVQDGPERLRQSLRKRVEIYAVVAAPIERSQPVIARMSDFLDSLALRRMSRVLARLDQTGGNRPLPGILALGEQRIAFRRIEQHAGCAYALVLDRIGPSEPITNASPRGGSTSCPRLCNNSFVTLPRIGALLGVAAVLLLSSDELAATLSGLNTAAIMLSG